MKERCQAVPSTTDTARHVRCSWSYQCTSRTLLLRFKTNNYQSLCMCWFENDIKLSYLKILQLWPQVIIANNNQCVYDNNSHSLAKISPHNQKLLASPNFW